MQIKTTKKYYSATTRIVKSKNCQVSVRMWSNQNSHMLLVGLSYKVKHTLTTLWPSNPVPNIYPREIKAQGTQSLYTMFTAPLLMGTPTKSVIVEDKKMWYIHTMARRDLQHTNILGKEDRQKKAQADRIPFVWNPRLGKTICSSGQQMGSCLG